MRKFLIPIVIVAILLVAGYYSVTNWQQQQQANTISQYQTAVIGFGNLTSSVGATGTVQPHQSAIVVWETSGTTSAVMVNTGDQVIAGQELAQLDPDSLAQNVILAKADLVNSEKALDDLKNTQASQLKALQTVRSAEKAVIEAERLLGRYDATPYKDSVDKARETVIDTEDDFKKAEDDFKPYADFSPDNQRRKDAQKKVDEARLKYEEAVRTLNLLLLEKEQAVVGLDLAKAQLADAQREYDRLKNGPDPRDIAALEARIQAAQATLAQQTLKAPFAGTITDINVMPGDDVTPGKAAFRLDDLSKLNVDVRVTEVDINRIQLGQDVSLTFDAIPNKPYKGLISEVAAVGTSIQGVVEFVVTVTLTDADESVRPGMTGAISIIIEQLDNVLLLPNRAVRLLNNQRVVYILQNNSLQAVAITLGATSDNFSEVIGGGLSAGNVVVLNPPQQFDSNGPPPFARR